MMIKIMIYADGKLIRTTEGELYEDNPRGGKTNRKTIESLADEVTFSLEEQVKEIIKIPSMT